MLTNWNGSLEISKEHRRRRFAVSRDQISDENFGASAHTCNGIWNPNVRAPGGQYSIRYLNQEYGWVLEYTAPDRQRWWLFDLKMEWYIMGPVQNKYADTETYMRQALSR